MLLSNTWKWIGCLSILMMGLIIARRIVAQDSRADGVAQRFKQLDTDGDDKLSKTELRAAPPIAQMLKGADKDGDGFVSLRETMAHLGGQVRAKTPGSPPGSPTSNDAVAKSSAPATEMELSPRQGPKIFKAGDNGVGRLTQTVSFTDLDGKTYSFADLSQSKSIVFAMTSTSCPISKKYLPTLSKLAEAYSSRGIRFVLVNTVASDKPSDMETAKKSFGDRAIYVFDKKLALAKTLGATTTTDVVMVDSSRTVLYHGAIDDQYGFGYSIDEPRQNYLVDAIEACLSERSLLVSATSAPGCVLDIGQASSTLSNVTYHNRISRIMQRNCVECHRDGGVGPFELDSYADVEAHAAMIKQVVERNVMPPWFAATPARGHVSPWGNDRSLAESERDDLLSWLASGKPEGERSEGIRSQTYAEGWLIGKPDAIYEFTNPVAIKATGTMPYKQVVVETHLTEDKWVQAIEVQPGNRSVVHHVLVFVQKGDDSDAVSEGDEAEGRDGYWAIYVPGNSTRIFPTGFAKRIPKGAKLRFQMHYTPNGTETEDRTRIGLVFAKQLPEHEVRVAGVVNARLSIPPGAENHEESATIRLPMDIQVLGLLPHMHVRAKACRYDLVSTDNTAKTLLDIPRYDFNWQLLYNYLDPLPLSQGSTIKFTVWYDNSRNNPANPDPTKTVRWGSQTFDEMLLGYVEYFVASDKPGESSSMMEARGIAVRGNLGGSGGFDLEAIFKRLDRNNDGKLTKDEIPEAMRENVMRLDVNQDGAISPKETEGFKGLRNRP